MPAWSGPSTRASPDREQRRDLNRHRCRGTGAGAPTWFFSTATGQVLRWLRATVAAGDPSAGRWCFPMAGSACLACRHGRLAGCRSTRPRRPPLPMSMPTRKTPHWPPPCGWRSRGDTRPCWPHAPTGAVGDLVGPCTLDSITLCSGRPCTCGCARPACQAPCGASAGATRCRLPAIRHSRVARPSAIRPDVVGSGTGVVRNSPLALLKAAVAGNRMSR